MRFSTPFKLLQSRPACIGLFAGTITAMAGWWLLPPAPRQTIALQKSNWRHLIFSPDFAYAAERMWTAPPNSKSADRTNVLDLNTGSTLFTLLLPRLPPDVQYAFNMPAVSAQERMLVEFGSGKARFHRIPSGEALESDLTFPPSPADVLPTSRMTTDRTGRLMVVTTDRANRATVRDMFSGKEIGNFETKENLEQFFPGCTLTMDFSGRSWIREMPTGNLLGEVDTKWGTVPIGERLFFTTNVTPDGKTLVIFNGQVHICDVSSGNHRMLDVPAADVRSVSPDGRYFIATVARRGIWFLHWLGIDTSHVDLVLYEMRTGAEIASFPRGFSEFSLDGKSLAIVPDEEDSRLCFYDFPLRTPWPRIVGYAMSVGAIVGMLIWFTRRAVRKLPKARAGEGSEI